MKRANFYTECNKVCLKNEKRLFKISDFVEKEQINYMIYEIGLSYECILHHVNVNYYEEYNLSILTGDSNCEDCNEVDNIVFDHGTFTFHSIPFVHKVTFLSENSSPEFLFKLVYIAEQWLLISYGNILNKLIFYGSTFEELFYKSWGFNRISILPKNQCHLFSKSLKSIIENTNNDFSYLFSYYKQDQFCLISKKLKLLFPFKTGTKIRFSYPVIGFIDEKESWSVINNFKKRTTMKKLKKFSIITNVNSSMEKSFNLLISSGSLKKTLTLIDPPYLELINPKLLSYHL